MLWVEGIVSGIWNYSGLEGSAVQLVNMVTGCWIVFLELSSTRAMRMHGLE